VTARVMVNRIWQWHFGRGLVATPNDFGEMGERPTHPQLLDWLAHEFVASGWSIKAMHRLIMNSATYQMSSRYGSDEHFKTDPDNRYLWRMNRRRLEAEILWDTVHAAAGTLNLKMGGRPVVPPLAEDEIASLRDRWHWPISADPSEHTRRGLYILVRRNFRFPMFEVFDAPVTSVSCPSRSVTTVAPQALWSLNNASVHRQARAFAKRVTEQAGHKMEARIQMAWMIALCRAPTDREMDQAIHLLGDLRSLSAGKEAGSSSDESVPVDDDGETLAKLCLCLFNLNEFSFVD